MKRHDNEDLTGMDIPAPPYRSETYFGKGGNSVADENSAFSKITTVGKWDVYFIWFWRGVLFDPYNGTDILRRSQETQAKFKKVDKETFELYMRYLKTKNMLYLTRARRKALEKA